VYGQFILQILDFLRYYAKLIGSYRRFEIICRSHFKSQAVQVTLLGLLGTSSTCWLLNPIRYRGQECVGLYFHFPILLRGVHRNNFTLPWFQTLAVFWMLYAFIRLISRFLNFIRRRFETLCSIFIGGRYLLPLTYPPMKMEQTECSEMLEYKIQTPGNYPEESIQQFLPLLFLLLYYLLFPALL